MEIKRYTCGNGDGMFELKNGNYVEFSELEQYANQKVIDELECLVMSKQKEIECDGSTYHILYTHDFSERIKELKK